MLESSGSQPVVPLITGPTGVGKTSLSLELASRIGGEIVNADSRQVYRGMDIGTAKPDPSERTGTPHHLFDILDPTELISAGKYLRLAELTFRDILSRGKIPIVVGGSTLYTYALTHGLADIPDVDPAVRMTVEKRVVEEGLDRLYEELSRLDPVSAASMDASKSQRIVRALEVYHSTGQPLSSYFRNATRLPYRFSVFIFDMDRTKLYDRINTRVDSMIASGLIDEVKNLRDGGRNDDVYALRSPGYREVISHLNGEIDQTEMTRLIKRNTRRYAKRQFTWYRRYDERFWIKKDGLTAESIEKAIDDHIFSP